MLHLRCLRGDFFVEFLKTTHLSEKTTPQPGKRPEGAQHNRRERYTTRPEKSKYQTFRENRAMYAIIVDGGRQYRVEPGMEVDVDYRDVQGEVSPLKKSRQWRRWFAARFPNG